MRKLVIRALSLMYGWVKSNRYLSALYYDVANAKYFDDLQIHEKMLADRVRVDSYHRAIRKHVKEGDVVIELGTGTGILSFFAAAQAPKTIYAIEHGRLIDTAKRVAQHNQISNIEFAHVNSKAFNVAAKADIIIHEQMGPFLFDEYMVENVLDLRDRALKPSGKILPGRFELFIEPAQIVDDSHVPFIWEQTIHGVSFSALRGLSGAVQGNYGYRFITPEEVDYFLCEPKPVLTIDLEKMKTSDLPTSIHYVRKVSRAGKLSGFCVYFNTIFDDEITFSTSPVGPWSCWSHPLLRVESNFYEEGDSIEFDLDIGNAAYSNTYRWSCAKRAAAVSAA